MMAALAAPVVIVAPSGPIRPGTPTVVHVAVTDSDGVAASLHPQVVGDQGRLRPVDEPTSPGVWAFLLLPPPTGSSVTLSVDSQGQRQVVTLPMEPLPASRLAFPGRLEALAGESEVRVRVTGPDLPPPEALQVVVGEGTLLGVDAVDGGLEVRLSTYASNYPRFVPIGVRDARRDESPSWSGIRLRTRFPINLQTEPGASLALTVGKREYGPFLADEHGILRVQIDQFPGEFAAQAVLIDDLGNETHTSLPLATQAEASIVAIASGDLVSGRPPPDIFLYAIAPDGEPWAGVAPDCRTPSSAALPPRQLVPGQWVVSLPETASLQDARVRCVLGGAAGTDVRIPVRGNVPARLALQVWPEEMSTDFPVAEVQAVLEDARGERLPAEGVRVWANLGEVETADATGFVTRAEYRGEAAVSVGGDVVHARYDLVAGRGPLVALGLGHADVPWSGSLIVHGRALDHDGRPLPGVSLDLRAGPNAATALTGEDGWASAELPLPPGVGPVVLEARSTWRVVRGIALRGTSGHSGPDHPDLEAERQVLITTGRVADLDLTVEPKVLYTGPGAVATIRVRVKDRAGSPVLAPPQELTVSEGTLGPLVAEADGTYVAEYSPPSGEQPRSIRIAARAEGASSDTELLLEPRPVDRSLLVGAGGLTNFGQINAPYLTFDLDLRTPLFRQAIMVRLGVAWYGQVADVDIGTGQAMLLRTTLLPVTLGLVGRREYRGSGYWLGLGGVLAPYVTRAQFGAEEQVGVGVYSPGIVLLGGLGKRLLGGEVLAEVRVTALSSPGGDFAFQGQVGGAAAIAGYRVIF
jgi:hypothetical protein